MYICIYVSMCLSIICLSVCLSFHSITTVPLENPNQYNQELDFWIKLPLSYFSLSKIILVCHIIVILISQVDFI